MKDFLAVVGAITLIVGAIVGVPLSLMAVMIWWDERRDTP